MSIAADKITFSFGKTLVLDSVSLRCNSGEFAAILGPNGCGKTTLFNIICRIYPIQGGTISLNGQPLAHYSRKQQAQILSVLAQTGMLPEFMTVHDMVMQGRFCYQSFLSRYSQSDLAVVAQAMEALDVAHLAHKKVSQLSGGQVQRCRMAMVLAQETEIVLLDEPTTHLDLKHQYALLDMGKELAQQGKTVVAILHDMTQASLYADNVVILHNTKVYAQGIPQQVITDTMMADVFDIATKRIGNQRIGIHVPAYLA